MSWHVCAITIMFTFFCIIKQLQRNMRKQKNSECITGNIKKLLFLWNNGTKIKKKTSLCFTYTFPAVFKNAKIFASKKLGWYNLNKIDQVQIIIDGGKMGVHYITLSTVLYLWISPEERSVMGQFISTPSIIFSGMKIRMPKNEVLNH